MDLGPDGADCVAFSMPISTQEVSWRRRTRLLSARQFRRDRHPPPFPGGALLILACVYFAASRRKWRALPWPPASFRWSGHPYDAGGAGGGTSRTHRLGSRQLLRSAQGGRISRRRAADPRLTIDGLIQGRCGRRQRNRFTNTPISSSVCRWRCALVAILMVGLGTGVAARALAALDTSRSIMSSNSIPASMRAAVRHFPSLRPIRWPSRPPHLPRPTRRRLTTCSSMSSSGHHAGLPALAGGLARHKVVPLGVCWPPASWAAPIPKGHAAQHPWRP